VSPGDGPSSEFYYDGKTMVAFAPAENLVAIAEAPSTIDAALEKAVSVAMRLSFASRATSVMLMVPLLSRPEVPMLRWLL